MSFGTLPSSTLGSATIGGSIGADGTAVQLTAIAGIGSLKVGGNLRALRGGTLEISTDKAIGTIAIAGNILGASATSPIQIKGHSRLSGIILGDDTALASLTVGGSVENTHISVGTKSVPGGDADASIGNIFVGHEWIASSAEAGVANGKKLSGSGVRDATQLASTIASILIKGQAFGSPARGDRFEIAAEQILAATIGKVKLPFHPGPDHFLASSNTYDFSLREITA